MEKDTIELTLIDEEELLAGLLILTKNNLGKATILLGKVKNETVKAIKAQIKQDNTPQLDAAIKETAKQETLTRFNSDLKRELNLARRRAQYALKNNMAQSDYHPDKRPKNTAAHHLAASTDPRARIALDILFKFSIQCHHEANGVDLPRYVRDQNHKDMPNAIAHSKTHTDFYYDNVNITLLRVNVPDATQDDVIKALRDIARDLQMGLFPITEAIEL